MAMTNSTRRPHNFIDLTGQAFGDWFVVRFLENATSKARWMCRCSCGRERPLPASRLNGGKTLRCKSCSNRLNATRHGKTNTREFKSWHSMLDRCYRSTDKEYINYGGRGITVCDRWKTSFINFFADMGPRPNGRTLDRLDNNGNYEPANCRWATHKEQGRNRRMNVILEHNGHSQCMSAWAEDIGISIQTLYQRLKLGWTVEQALTTPPGTPRKQHT